MQTPLERAARATREEIVRQYRDDERRACPAGTNFYEEEVSPYLIARAVLQAIREPNPAHIEKCSEYTFASASQKECAQFWQAMLDTALKDE